MVSRHEGWRDVAERFAAIRAVLGSDEFGAEPVASGFASWVNALNRGARHKGHHALSPWLPAHPEG